MHTETLPASLGCERPWHANCRIRAPYCVVAEDVFICNGSQQALDLLGRILIEPGTRVAIEDPG